MKKLLDFYLESTPNKLSLNLGSQLQNERLKSLNDCYGGGSPSNQKIFNLNQSTMPPLLNEEERRGSTSSSLDSQSKLKKLKDISITPFREKSIRKNSNSGVKVSSRNTINSFNQNFYDDSQSSYQSNITHQSEHKSLDNSIKPKAKQNKLTWRESYECVKQNTYHKNIDSEEEEDDIHKSKISEQEKSLSISYYQMLSNIQQRSCSSEQEYRNWNLFEKHADQMKATDTKWNFDSRFNQGRRRSSNLLNYCQTSESQESQPKEKFNAVCFKKRESPTKKQNQKQLNLSLYVPEDLINSRKQTSEESKIFKRKIRTSKPKDKLPNLEESQNDSNQMSLRQSNNSTLNSQLQKQYSQSQPIQDQQQQQQLPIFLNQKVQKAREGFLPQKISKFYREQYQKNHFLNQKSKEYQMINEATLQVLNNILLVNKQTTSEFRFSSVNFRRKNPSPKAQQFRV